MAAVGPVGPQLLGQRRSPTSETIGVTLWMQWDGAEEREISGRQQIMTQRRALEPPQLNERETTSMQHDSGSVTQLAGGAEMPNEGNEREEEVEVIAAEEEAGDRVEAAAEVVRAAEEEAEDRTGEGKREGKDQIGEQEAEEEKREGTDGAREHRHHVASSTSRSNSSGSHSRAKSSDVQIGGLTTEDGESSKRISLREAGGFAE